MIPDELPKFSIPHLENKAAKFLRENGEIGDHIPIDIDLLLERLEDVDLDVYRGLEENFDIQGCVLRDTKSGSLVVLIDEKLTDCAGPGVP